MKRGEGMTHSAARLNNGQQPISSSSMCYHEVGVWGVRLTVSYLCERLYETIYSSFSKCGNRSLWNYG